MKLVLVLLFAIYSYSFDVIKPKVYKGDEDIKGWVMSEKLDGIRAYWTGKELLTRKGNKIYAPKWLIKDFPKFELDGELWTKRSDFENIQNIVMDKKPSDDWNKITYNIFEVPNEKGDFIKRINKIQKWLEKNPNKYIKVIKQIPIKDKEHLNLFLEDIILKNGEGVIIRDPNKEFHIGRSSHILKVKKFSDMEGKVIGKNISEKTGVLKNLVIQLKNGIVFKLGTGFTKNERINPPKTGDVVTFKYYGFTKKGKPKFASFLHIRED